MFHGDTVCSCIALSFMASNRLIVIYTSTICHSEICLVREVLSSKGSSFRLLFRFSFWMGALCFFAEKFALLAIGVTGATRASSRSASLARVQCWAASHRQISLRLSDQSFPSHLPFDTHVNPSSAVIHAQLKRNRLTRAVLRPQRFDAHQAPVLEWLECRLDRN
jgi:hypothetical protein